MIVTKHLTEAQRILQEHCNNCRNKGPGCAVCHISQAIKEINSAQAAVTTKRTVWCNNSHCAWNSRINKEPDDGEQCLFIGELTLEVQEYHCGLACTNFKAPLSKEGIEC